MWLCTTLKLQRWEHAYLCFCIRYQQVFNPRCMRMSEGYSTWSGGLSVQLLWHYENWLLITGFSAALSHQHQHTNYWFRQGSTGYKVAYSDSSSLSATEAWKITRWFLLNNSIRDMARKATMHPQNWLSISTRLSPSAPWRGKAMYSGARRPVLL